MDHRAHNQLDTPEREWIPARLGRNALHGISFLNGAGGVGGGSLWHPSVCDEENLRRLVKSENVWEGQKQVHRRRHDLGQVSEPALSMQSCTADPTLPAALLILLSPEAGQKGKM